MKSYRLTHARHDPVHCLAPGLFRSLRRGERKKAKLDVIYKFGDERLIEFSGPEPLGADDLRVLQGLVALGGPNGVLLHPEPKTESGKQLRLSLEPKWDAIEQDAIVVKSSYYTLAKEIGYANPRDTRPIRECIERLWKISIIVKNGSNRQGFRLLSDYASDEQEGRLFVALNPLIAQAIIGGKNRQFVRIEMDEVRSLHTDPARLIHQRLCAWIDPGKQGKTEIDTLCEYVRPRRDDDSSEAIKKRRQTVRRALTELVAVGWAVHEYARGKFEIRRPKAKISQ
ncbi:plasmid and phage iteron-binding protein [Sulfobacillus thermosulfidooxidans DSM 9293]|uniref:Plasmid and phage iteron-binding protein n=1 Tax=Sulfobacillus thermosulfidooxidans (strain DSM 9293 / VKM B-1269 / AT-1) TaxID=929705 RepID=A0A1W1WLK9_SULTA|nr:replication protein C, IncQ-type [Sulfobacillus thermosulfidooxidans]SMC06910.1 plasmid and phage iteron-binding protein [Sulfobacillus thermosulfidooxidans DSM 9293]